MPGILHPHAVLRVEQEHAQQVEGLLGTRHYHHLLCAAVDAARVIQVGGKRLAQRLLALQFAIAEHGLARLAQVATQQALPERHGKGIVGGVAGQERGWTIRVPGRVADPAEMVAAHRQQRLAEAGQARRLLRLVGRCGAALPLGADVGAGTGARRQEAFRDQLIEGIENGDSRQAQLRTQGARRRQAHTAMQAAAEDLLADLQVQLAIQRHRAAAIQLDTGKQHATGNFHGVCASSGLMTCARRHG
ncbi:hypothetical protein D3C84_387770 [compost metagenome]